MNNSDQIAPLDERRTTAKPILWAASNTIFEAVAAIRDTTAYTEVHKASVCLLTLDVKEAFDRISHDYLNAIVCEYGFSVDFCMRLQKIDANATSRLTIKGERFQPIPIQRSVRQGCPTSMSLFVLLLIHCSMP